jgi:flagellar hook-basal body complex protein FliE
MSTIHGPNSSGLKVNIDVTRQRQTPKTSFGDTLSAGINRTADTVAQASHAAAPFIPGGAVLSAAVSGLGTVRSSQSGASAPNASGLVATGSASTASGAPVGSGGDSIENLAASGDTGATLLQATREMQEMSQQFNLQYLQLQQNMQNENRKFSALSNVMKTKHDTAKSMIQNVR